MNIRKDDLFAEFTKSVVKTQTKFKGFLRCKFKEHNLDITFEMLQILLKLWEQDGINQQELANFTHKDKASLTYLINNLSKRDLVERVEDVNDRRNKLIVLKPEGARLRELVTPWIHEMYAIGGAGISAEVLKDGIALFEKIYSNFCKVNE